MTYDKPKNDKIKNEYRNVKERGGCLSVFLGFAVIANIAVALLTLILFNEYSQFSGVDTGFFTIVVIFSLVAAAATIACVWGLWNWKRWGYNGLMALYVLSMVVNLLSGSLQTVAGSAIGMGILYFLMKDKMHYLD